MLQPFTPIEALTAGLPGLLLGFLVGYMLGATKSFSSRDRFFIALAVGVLGGIVIILILSTTGLVTVSSVEILLSIMATFGGIGVGAVLHWQPFASPPPKRHITFDPEEDDEEFDRQINEALGG